MHDPDPIPLRRRAPALAFVAVLASLLLFWNLGARYLWQDEAACAVLAERLMERGRPHSYDGTNLITMDVFEHDDVPPTGAAGDAVRHFLDQGDFKADTSWIGQPWGQFVLAGVSMKLFGSDTLPARAPFALAAVLTAVVLFALVQRRFGSTPMALIAVLLLLGNTYWFLHVRQCRYYAISSLFLLLSVASYLRWQDGRRFGAALFVLAAWCFFQSDFGSFWPVMGVLSLDAVWNGAGRRLRNLGVLAIVGASVAPFVFFYEMHGRLKDTVYDWHVIQLMLLSLTNRYLLPFVVLAALAWLFWRRRGCARPGQWRFLGLCVGILFAQLVWMPAVGPYWFYRYVVDMTPLTCLVMAFVSVRLVRSSALAFLLGALLLFSPLPSLLVEPLIRPPERYRQLLPEPGLALRKELGIYAETLRADAPDPNRAVVEYLRPRLEPGDEVLINYEDTPLMFYLDNPIRGGIPCFRVEDSGVPRFAVLRPDVTICHWEVYERSFARHRWRKHEMNVPGVTWGNNPDPLWHYSRTQNRAQAIRLFEYHETK